MGGRPGQAAEAKSVKSLACWREARGEGLSAGTASCSGHRGCLARWDTQRLDGQDATAGTALRMQHWPRGVSHAAAAGCMRNRRTWRAGAGAAVGACALHRDALDAAQAGVAAGQPRVRVGRAAAPGSTAQQGRVRRTARRALAATSSQRGRAGGTRAHFCSLRTVLPPWRVARRGASRAPLAQRWHRTMLCTLSCQRSQCMCAGGTAGTAKCLHGVVSGRWSGQAAAPLRQQALLAATPAHGTLPLPRAPCTPPTAARRHCPAGPTLARAHPQARICRAGRGCTPGCPRSRTPCPRRRRCTRSRCSWSRRGTWRRP